MHAQWTKRLDYLLSRLLLIMSCESLAKYMQLDNETKCYYYNIGCE